MPETRQEEEKGKLVNFPADEERLPSARLPSMVGRIGEGHPLLRPLIIAFVVLAIILGVQVVVSLIGAHEKNDRATFTESYREAGTITYEGGRLQGWFLDTERQHFLAQDGRRFTYVDAHSREGSPVSGYWRLVE
jgi:hypothetical protein